jgi:hypothetical protein
MNDIRKYRNKLVTREDLGLWEGDVAPILDETKEVDLHWKGGKLPPRLIFECLKWFRMVNDKHSSEAQARLGYNPETKEWKWFAFPQYVVAGLYSKEIPSNELTEEQKAMRLRATKEMADGGFIDAGTIHSHCDAGAFASGTDDKDEITQNGVHLTLGRISSENPEIHGRVVFRKIRYPIHWEDWLDRAPAGLSDCWEFSAKGVEGVTIDEERLMGLCFEQPEPARRTTRYGWPSGGWGWGEDDGRLPLHYGGLGIREWGTDGDWDLIGADPVKGEAPARTAESLLDEFVDGTLDELYYGLGFDEDAVIRFLGQYARRLVEAEVYAASDVIDEVVRGVVEAREALSAGTPHSAREPAPEA